MSRLQYNYIYYFNVMKIKFFILFVILVLKPIKTELIPNFKSIYLSSDYYYIVTYDKITYYNNANNVNNITYEFQGEQIITSPEQSEMVSFGRFKNIDYVANLLIVKHYIYAVIDGTKYCDEILNEIQGYQPAVYPYKCQDSYCYYIVGIINSNNQLCLYLYKTPSSYCSSSVVAQIIINNISSKNINCQIMNSTNEEVLTCFYENENQNEIIANIFNIELSQEENNIIFSSSFTKSKGNKGGKIIKSELFEDNQKAFVCFLENDSNSDCQCLTYNIINNEWSDYSTYLTSCLSEINSLNIEYFDNSDEFIVYCSQSQSKLDLKKFNQNFEIKDSDANGAYDLSNSLIGCNNYYLSSLVHSSNNIKVFVNCNNSIIEYLAEKEFESFPSESMNNKLIINSEKSNKSKEEMINNMTGIINEYNIGEILEIYGKDYNIKISPINIKENKQISSYIDFFACEEQLRNYYHLSDDSILTVFQIEINKNNSKSLINQIEYAIFDELKTGLNLSICSNTSIKIYYSIDNSSVLDISTISHFSKMGVDIFNINDSFFNDICYPYSEGDSDLILKDRVNDIYQNYSLCDSNCQYDNMDIENMTIACDCQVKQEIQSEIEELHYNEIINDIIEYSTFEVIKCYKLVFNLNKKNNIGFWIFLSVILLHIPFIIYYIKFKDNNIKNFIAKEMMNEFNNLNKIGNPMRKRNKTVKFTKSNANIFRKQIKGKINKMKKLSYKDLRKKMKFETSTKNELLNEINNGSSKRKMSDLNHYNNKILVKKKHNTLIIKSSKKQIDKVNNKFNNDKEHNSISIKKDSSMEINKINNCCLIKMNIPENNIILKINLYYNNYEDAIKYEKRKFLEILCSMIVLKQKIINIFCFFSPLELKSLHICLVLFIYSCNFALNTLFYFSDKISDKYHYKGKDLYLYSLINNIIICIISTILSSVIVMLLSFLINSKNEIQDIIRIKNDSKIIENFNVNTEEGKTKFMKLSKIFNKLRIKVILFIIIELMLLLFFFYFTTAFCEVYKSTQITWIIDCSISFVISFIFEIMISFIVSLLYKFSINYKITFLYQILRVLL